MNNGPRFIRDRNVVVWYFSMFFVFFVSYIFEIKYGFVFPGYTLSSSCVDWPATVNLFHYSSSLSVVVIGFVVAFKWDASEFNIGFWGFVFCLFLFVLVVGYIYYGVPVDKVYLISRKKIIKDFYCANPVGTFVYLFSMANISVFVISAFFIAIKKYLKL